MQSVEPDISVRPLPERDVSEAARICRLAFGTFLGLPDPMQVFGDKEMVANRWKANPDGVLGAYSNGSLVGSCVVSRWGKFGWFGPLTVRPDFWDKGVAKSLLGPTMKLFSRWRTTHQGLFTFPNSPKHLGLYEKYGFSARHLTPVMSKSVDRKASRNRVGTFSRLGSSKEKARALREGRDLTDRLYPGLDLGDEIAAVDRLGLGDTILLNDDSRLTGFAVCHSGASTEGGTGNCFVKFGAAAPGRLARQRFHSLLSGVEGYASARGLATIEAGVNHGRREAYNRMKDAGFKTKFVGVAMERPDEPGFNRPGVLAIDDWR